MPVWKRRQPTATTAAGEAIPGYRELRQVGRGGFSVVYRAHQEQLDRMVALKVLSVEFIDAQVRRRFLREVHLTSRLTGHPNVVTVLDSGMTGSGRPYIAMEYFERGSLRDRLSAEGALPLPEVLRIGVKIAGALGAAHQEGVLHRDVKPQNILVSRYGEPALADFGTARLTAALDVSSRTEALTPYHAAPEVLEGKAPSPACDVYSLGSTLYQLLSGRAPYQTDDGGIAALLLRLLNEDPPPITRPDVPARVVELLRRAMAKAPQDRFTDAWAFAYALQRVQVELGLVVTELVNAPSLPADQQVPHGAASEPPDEAAASETEPAPAIHPPPSTGVPESPSTAEPSEAKSAPDLPEEMPGWSAWAEATRHPEQPFDDSTSERGQTRDYPASDRTTVPRGTPETPSTSAPPVEEVLPGAAAPARGRRWPLLVGICVVGLAAVAAPLLFTGGNHASTPPAANSLPASGLATTPAGSVNGVPPDGPTTLDAARPTNVTAVDGGASVVLHWTPAPGTSSSNMVLLQQPPDAGHEPVKTLPPGKTSYIVTGLNPGTGYCFQVGPLLATGNPGQTGTVAWSAPTCIRGAVASVSPTK